MTLINCVSGPHDNTRYEYPDPLPHIIVIADKQLNYHEYARNHTRSSTYTYRRTYTQKRET